MSAWLSWSRDFPYYDDQDGMRRQCTNAGNALYQPDPGFQIDDVNGVDRLAGILSSSLERRTERDVLQRHSLAVWKEQYSPAAMAHAISKAAQMP